MTPATSGRRLAKRDVEALLGAYDDDPVAALTAALRVVLERPTATFAELVAAAPLDAARREALVRHDVDALDALVRELNEARTL